MSLTRDAVEAKGFAADCRHLRYTIDSSGDDGPVVALCDHPIRSGFRCVGPFLDETPTACRLWEPKQNTGPIDK